MNVEIGKNCVNIEKIIKTSWLICELGKEILAWKWKDFSNVWQMSKKCADGDDELSQLIINTMIARKIKTFIKLKVCKYLRMQFFWGKFYYKGKNFRNIFCKKLCTWRWLSMIAQKIYTFVNCKYVWMRFFTGKLLTWREKFSQYFCKKMCTWRWAHPLHTHTFEQSGFTGWMIDWWGEIEGLNNWSWWSWEMRCTCAIYKLHHTYFRLNGWIIFFAVT